MAVVLEEFEVEGGCEAGGICEGGKVFEVGEEEEVEIGGWFVGKLGGE